MKKTITICILILFSFILKAQSLSGTQTLPGIRGGAMSYTILNWKADYQIYKENEMFHILLSNAIVSVANNSMYGSYSKSDLGLNAWPDSDPKPYDFNLNLTIKLPDGSTTNNNVNILSASYIDVSQKFKDASTSSFKVVSVQSMYYNGGRDIVVDRLIESKKYGDKNTSQSSSNTTTKTNSKDTKTNETKSYELKLSDIGIPENNDNTTSEYQKSYQTGQQIATLATDIVDLFTPSPEKQARKERQRLEQIEKEKEESEIRQKSAETYFKTNYLDKYLKKAEADDEDYRMIIFFNKQRILYKYQSSLENLLPFSITKKWLDKAAENNNTDALCMKADTEIWSTNRNIEKGIEFFEKAANLGSIDAMFELAKYFNTKDAGNNQEKALFWYNKAAENGCPASMYHLGLIYRYGSTTMGVGFTLPYGKQIKNYKIKKDNAIAFQWFRKSISIVNFNKSLYGIGSYSSGSYEPIGPYKELSIMYEKGLGVEKDKIKADALFKIYNEN